MPSTTNNSNRPFITNLIDHLRLPLYRNGYALVFSSLASSALGMLYWILAARLYPTEVVGLNSAVISTAVFLANIAQLNFTNALNRFLPAAGRSTKRLISTSYLISTALTVLACLVFLIGIPIWAPSLEFLRDSRALFIGFIFGSVAWGLFALQDAVLTGLRTAVWVPVENILYSIFKIALLVSFATAIPRYGVMASWFAPLPLALLLISGLIYLRLSPRHTQATDDQREQIDARKITHYVAGDYIGSLFWMGAAHLQPIMITELAGPSATAYFFLSWQISYVLYLVSRQMGQSFVAEVAADPVKLNVYSINILKQTARMILPIVAVILVGAPYILRLFGEDYAAEATTLLRLLALSAVPQILVALYLSIARIQRRMVSLVGVQAAVSILAVVMIFSLVPIYGINGVGIAWLAAMTLVASFLAVTQLRNLWLIHLEMTLPMQVFNSLRGIVWNWGHTRAVADANEMVSNIIPNLTAGGSPVDRSLWNAREVMRTVSDVTVISIGPDNTPPLALLKMSRTEQGATSLRRQSQVLSALHHNEQLGDFKELLPKLWGEGEIDGRYYLLEELLPGVDGRKVVVDPLLRVRMLETSADAIVELHRRTAVVTPIGSDLIRRWVDDRLEVIRQVHMPGPAWMMYDRSIDRLREELRLKLNGRVASVGWVHGDYAPGNILVSADGSQVTGIVDWDLASAEDIPMLDIVHMLLSTRVLLERRELGHVIHELVHGNGPTEEERKLIERVQRLLPGDPVDMRSLILLSWLRHVSDNLTKSSRFASHTLWVTKNVEVVLGNLSPD